MLRSESTGSLGAVLFAGFCYAVTLVGLVTFIGFVSGLGSPIDVNTGPRWSWLTALLANVGLVIAWGIQHSVMARARFKRWWTQVIPPHTERAFYCLASGATLFAVCALWIPMDGVLWEIEGPTAIGLRVAQAMGWVVLLAASFEIDHFDLFGLAQPWRAWRGLPTPEVPFQQRVLYRFVRHPIQLGVLIGVWVTPIMTVGHLVFALLMSLYIQVGLYFEERALVREYGDVYRDYMLRVPRLIPGWRPLPNFVRPLTAQS
ncbi:MAG: isoprenylcysteine carboxylmethyltransferase family protein [Myxococcota bacterium]